MLLLTSRVLKIMRFPQLPSGSGSSVSACRPPSSLPGESASSGFGEGGGQLLCRSVGFTMVSFLPT